MSQEQFSKSFKQFVECSNWKEVIEERLKSFDKKDFSSVETSLVIGCGPGYFEIQFLQEITPNLKSATFIEPLESCFKDLHTNLEQFRKKVDTKTYNCKLEDWNNDGEKFDLVVMCHCLYHFADMKSVLDKCFEKFLRTKGLLYVEITDDAIQKSFANHVMEELKIETEPGNEKFKSVLELTGKHIYKKHLLKRDYCMENLEDCTDFMHFSCGFRRSKSEVLEAIRAVKNKGYNGCDYEFMYLVKNI